MQDLLNFLTLYWYAIVFLLILIYPLIPLRWLGLRETYYDFYYKKEIPAQKYSILRAIIHALLTPLQEVIVIWGLRGTVSIVIFVVIGIDLFFKKQLSKEAVTLVSIGILALYLEQLILNAKKITIWKIFEYESKQQSE